MTDTMLTKLRASPNFSVQLALDGRCFVAQDSEPYIQYWLDERERLLLGLFSGKRGASISEAIDAYFRLTEKPRSDSEERRVARAISGMSEARVLTPLGGETSRYSASMVDDYLNYRPFPAELTRHISKAAALQSTSRILDLAGGPGDLALQLARKSENVAMMELSHGFLRFAQARAKKGGRALAAYHDSCNRLLHHDGSYDTVTIAQALHWLDDIAVCRGISKILANDGHFFVVHNAMTLPDEHPLAYVFGSDSILGAKTKLGFEDEVSALMRRLALLFEALDASNVDRIDLAHGHQEPINPAGVTLFNQKRPFGPGFARAFLSSAHLTGAGLDEADFWTDLTKRCAAQSPASFLGTHHWAVLHFKRGGKAHEWTKSIQCDPVNISYSGKKDP